jgi:hypothetical protein
MSTLSPEVEELRVSLDRIRTMLENLIVRGLRASGAEELAQLKAFAEELERSGAGHVAAALAKLHEQIEKGEREGVKTLLLAQTSVRVLERLLTLRVVRSQYAAALQPDDAASAAMQHAAADEDDEEEDA